MVSAAIVTSSRLVAWTQVVEDPVPLPEEGQLSAEFRSFVEACMHKDPYKRPTAEGLLSHPFILKVPTTPSATCVHCSAHRLHIWISMPTSVLQTHGGIAFWDLLVTSKVLGAAHEETTGHTLFHAVHGGPRSHVRLLPLAPRWNRDLATLQMH